MRNHFLRAASAKLSLYQIISSLGLTTNLKICLDAGDSASYNPSVQTISWLNTSGTGYNFWRGNTSSAASDDPTFNGSAGGLSSSEYWSVDGGDFFSSTNRTAVPTWISNQHKNNALFSFACTFYMTSSTSPIGMFLTASGLASNQPGIIITTDTSRKFVFSVRGASGNVFSLTSTTAFNATAWNVAQLSIDEANNAYILNINGTVETGTCTYTSPDANDVFAFPRIGITGYAANTPNTFAPTGTRYAEIAFFDTALTSTNLTNIYNKIKGRFGL